MRLKHYLFRIITLIAVGMTCNLNVSATDYDSGLVGDVNHDGRLSITDISMLINDLLTDAHANYLSDVNRDRRLSIADVSELIDMVLNYPDCNLCFTIDDWRFTMVRVKGGTFTLGATQGQDSEAYYDEFPAHQVTLSDYYIGQCEVDQMLWYHVMDGLPLDNDDQECPVVNVSWEDCQDFINTLNQLTGLNFRLPTEAEWEFAARGGNLSQHYKYSGSNDFDEVAWCEENSNDWLHRTGEKKPNELGIYDMSGNAWEWCYDWWGMYESAAVVNPTGPESGSERVCRGGCMNGHARFCRIGYRMSYPPSTRRPELGFRLAL